MENTKPDFKGLIEALQTVVGGFITIQGAAKFFFESKEFSTQLVKIQSKLKNK